jgi:hypothetical protein
MINHPNHINFVKAIYKQGVFKPVEPIPDLFDDQPVQLQIWPVPQEESAVLETPDELGHADNREWAALSAWEQQGRRDPVSTPEEEMARIQWVEDNFASIPLPSDQALEIAMADWLAEENLTL